MSILESTEQLARSGFTNQNISFVPPVTDNQTVNQEEIVQENFGECFHRCTVVDSLLVVYITFKLHCWWCTLPSHCTALPLPSPAIQSNRFNPKSFMQPTFQVSFPKVSLSAFANRNLVPQIVIPGDFLSALLPGLLICIDSYLFVYMHAHIQMTTLTYLRISVSLPLIL